LEQVENGVAVRMAVIYLLAQSRLHKHWVKSTQSLGHPGRTTILNHTGQACTYLSALSSWAKRRILTKWSSLIPLAIPVAQQSKIIQAKPARISLPCHPERNEGS
jgi:hypothetical protein